MLQYQTIPVTPFQQNCSLIWDDQTQQAAVIDPGGDLDLILSEVQQRGLKLEQIWLTHAHIVTVHDAGLSAHGVYIAMERLRGRDLRRALQDGWKPGAAGAVALGRRGQRDVAVVGLRCACTGSERGPVRRMAPARRRRSH